MCIHIHMYNIYIYTYTRPRIAWQRLAQIGAFVFPIAAMLTINYHYFISIFMTVSLFSLGGGFSRLRHGHAQGRRR